MAQQAVPQPPEPPEIERRLLLTRLQMVGLPVIVLIPVLALAGVFGLSQGERSEASGALEITVQYPNRTRLRTTAALVIEVGNAGDRAIDDATMLVDRAYIDSFEQVTFTPSISSVSEDRYRIDLGEIPAGATRLVKAGMRAQAYWLRSGTVTVIGEDVEETAVEVSTFVFP